MTTRSKLMFGIGLGVLLVVMAGEAWLLAERAGRHAELEAKVRQLEADIRRWSEQRERAVRELETARTAAAAAARERAAGPANDLLSTRERDAWLARTRQLKQLFADRPDQAIPELRLLSDRDWLRLGKDARFDSDAGIRKALVLARTQAKGRFVAQLDRALRAYAKQSGGQLPADISQLISYFESPPDAAMLQRYHMTRGGNITDGPTEAAIQERALIDPEQDCLFHVQVSGGYGCESGPGVEFRRPMFQAERAYRQANNGREVENPKDLAAYFNPPLDAVRQQRFIEFVEQMQAAQRTRDGRATAK